MNSIENESIYSFFPAIYAGFLTLEPATRVILHNKNEKVMRRVNRTKQIVGKEYSPF